MKQKKTGKPRKRPRSGPPKDILTFQNELLQDFVNNIPDSIYFKDIEGRIVFANASYVKCLGLSPQDVLGKTDFDLLPAHLAERIQRDTQKVIRSRKPLIDKVDKVATPQGEVSYMSSTMIPRFNARNKCIGVMGIMRDITKRLQFEWLQEEWLVMEKKLLMLEDMNRVKSEFVSAVSHEIRTPLAIIKQLFLLIYDETAGSINNQQRELLVKANNNIDRLQHIIEELLDISRIEGQKFRLSYSLVKIKDLLQSNAPFFKEFADAKGITLKYRLPKKDINVFIDPERVQQIITNLINNAIKFTPEKGTVIVELKVLNTKIRIGVLDDGIGIPEEDVPRVFDRFVQVTDDDGTKKKGIGLGLTIVKALVEKHGGEIWVESTKGQGSKFYFTLPMFYTTNLVNKNVRKKINALLSQKKSVSLINLLVVNYADFQERVDVGATRLFQELRKIVVYASRQVFKSSSDDDFVFVSNMKAGVLTVVFPYSAREEPMFCDLIRQRIKHYLVKNSLNEIFMALGLVSYSNDFDAYEQPERKNFSIKEFYIGSEMRLYKRIKYLASAEVHSPKKPVTVALTQDLSLGGICCKMDFSLKTDDEVKIVVPLIKTKSKLTAHGRVAWIARVDSLSGKFTSQYKIGVEFTDLNKRNRSLLAKELRLYYE